MRQILARLVPMAIAIGSLSVSATLAHMPAQQVEVTVPADTHNDVRARAIESYVVQRGLRKRTVAAFETRKEIAERPPGLMAAAPVIGIAVSGAVEIPVLTMTYADTPAPPYPSRDLQQQLFDGPWPTGTMTQHYQEMSRNRFTVTGEVFDWVKLPENETFYVGSAGCNGICNQSNVGVMLRTALSEIDDAVDFSRYDNNGPDNVPNSTDDDGFVDFVAFVHPMIGGECGGTSNPSAWSHRFTLGSLGGAFETNDQSIHGVNVVIDDYVIMPALACDGQTMIQIGVFSHEFGHAFGLPDLYDSREPDQSSGIGGWDLMASGSWGGDGSSRPDLPAHMSAWSKEFLGWVVPEVIEVDTMNVEIEPVLTEGDVVRVDYNSAADPNDTRYLLLEYRVQNGFDTSLSNSGLLATEVNSLRVKAGLVDNTVNSDPFAMGINVVEADGKRDLDTKANRGDPADVFPGTEGVTSFDISHAESIPAAVCNIRQSPEKIVLDIFTSRTTCPDLIAQAAVPVATTDLTKLLLGQEIVVEGVLANDGTNFFTDRQLVIRGDNGVAISVTTPIPVENAQPSPAAPETTVQPQDLADVLGKRVVIRGELTRTLQKGEGLTNVLVIEEIELLE